MSDGPIWPPRRPGDGGADTPAGESASRSAGSAGQSSATPYPVGQNAAPGQAYPTQQPSTPSAYPAGQNSAGTTAYATSQNSGPTRAHPISQNSAAGQAYPPRQPGDGGVGQQPPAQPAPATSAKPGRRFSPGVLIAVILTIAVIVIAILLWLTMPRNNPAPVVTVYAPDSAVSAPSTGSAAPASGAASATPTDSPSATTATSTPTPTPTPSATTDAQALAQLESLRNSDIGTVQTNSQWVAMLSSKWVGVTDPQQTTASGGHTFGALDILNEHLAFRNATTNQGARIALIYGTDYGTQVTHDGATMYVTIALKSWDTQDSVQSWCQARFPDKSGDALRNTCMPVQLTPKH